MTWSEQCSTESFLARVNAICTQCRHGECVPELPTCCSNFLWRSEVSLPQERHLAESFYSQKLSAIFREREQRSLQNFRCFTKFGDHFRTDSQFKWAKAKSKHLVIEIVYSQKWSFRNRFLTYKPFPFLLTFLINCLAQLMEFEPKEFAL